MLLGRGRAARAWDSAIESLETQGGKHNDPAKEFRVAFIEGFFTLVGRILLAAIFLGTAVGFIQNPQDAQEKMRGVQMDKLYPTDERTVPVLMWAAVGCLVVGGISVFFGA